MDITGRMRCRLDRLVCWLVGWLICSVTINDSPTYKYRSVIYMNLNTITANTGRKKFKMIKFSLSKNGLELEASLKQMSVGAVAVFASNWQQHKFVNSVLVFPRPHPHHDLVLSRTLLEQQLLKLINHRFGVCFLCSSINIPWSSTYYRHVCLLTIQS